jgi:hypothetical protein
VITRPIHNLQEIFLALYNTRNANIRKEQEDRREREQKRDLKWRYLESLPLSDRYDVSLGRYITKEDLKLHPCAHPRCLRSFDTESAMKSHAWSHYCQQR